MNKKILISLVGLIISLGLGFFLIKPFWFAIKGLRTEIAQQKSEKADLQKLLNKTNQLKEEYQKVEKEAEAVSLALPQEKDIPYLLGQFESLASSNGLLLESIDFGSLAEEKVVKQREVAPGPAASETNRSASSVGQKIALRDALVDLSLSGSYDAFKNYLTALENIQRLLEIRSISFSSGEEEEEMANLGIFNFDLGLVVYYQQ